MAGRTDDGVHGADAFAQALVAELPRLVRLATRLVRDADQAEDCAQETIVGRGAAGTSYVTRRPSRPGSGAVWSTASSTGPVSTATSSTLTPSRRTGRTITIRSRPTACLERAELNDELEDALARLPVIYRMPVVLHDVVGWTAVEIARAMDAGLPATKQRLRRGRMILVSALAEGDERRLASLAQPLRCWRARQHVSAYLDGELDAGTRSTVEAHLETCPTCPPLYAGLVGVKASLGGLRDPDTVVEDAIAGRIRDHLDGQSGRSR